MYTSWVTNKDTLPSHDVFISHRWDDNDDIITKMLFDAFLEQYVVRAVHRAVQVFFDDVRLKGAADSTSVWGCAN